MSRSAKAKRVQIVHFDTRREMSKWLARQRYASASPNASSAGSLTFYTRLLPRQIRSANFAPVEPHSASGGGGRGNTPGSYESPDDGDSACASDTAPLSLCLPHGAHRGAPYSMFPSVPDTWAC